MKWFISSDVHSFFDEWMLALREAGFDRDNKEHGIIVLGDLLDRGEKPLECLEFANSMHREGRAILVKGNHEDLFEQVYERDYFESHDEYNGTLGTYIKLANFDKEHNSLMRNQKVIIEDGFNNSFVKEYLSNLVNYAELGDNVFVHGWIPLKFAGKSIWDNTLAYNPNWREAQDFEWEDARWYNGMYQWHDGKFEKGKTIWCGHWHSSYGNAYYHNDGVEYMKKIETITIDHETGKNWPYVNNKPFKDSGIVAMDACTALSGFVNVEVLEI